MKVLLDECVPRRLKREFVGHSASTVPEAGFAGLKNGRLLRAASVAGFEVLITVDQNLISQQNVSNLPVAVLILVAIHNKYEALLPLMPGVLVALQTIQTGEVMQVPGSN
jgi:predicted nuclease of predicted toxin-antitoxin system